MSGGEVTSQSALAKLTVAAPLLAQDPLLALVVALCPPKQLTVATKKKGTDLALGLNNDALTLTHRNAILRSLCGMALHNQLDGAPLYLLGGNSAPGGGAVAASPDAALALAGISSWMSVADSIRQDSQELAQLLDHLEEVLGERADRLEVVARVDGVQGAEAVANRLDREGERVRVRVHRPGDELGIRHHRGATRAGAREGAALPATTPVGAL